MSKNKYEFTELEELFPHSPDVLERHTSDNGFSAGWGMHFMPLEKYWLDVHTHIQKEYMGKLDEIINNFLKLIKDFNVTRMAVILPMMSKGEEGEDYTGLLQCFLQTVRKNGELLPVFYMDYKDPDAGFLEEVCKMGVAGIKLHNAQVISEGGDHEVWLSHEWQRVFEVIEKLRLPVIWHVTQRLTDSPYTGGGRNTYWRDGWKKRIEYANEDLLQVFLQVVEQYPGINFISAHQLHLGWERLGGLFDRYGNLYTDTSCGCRLNRFDSLYEHDRCFLRDVFVKYSHRILFGTDAMLEHAADSRYLEELYSSSFSFIKQLRLPEAALQRIAWQNAERLFGINK